MADGINTLHDWARRFRGAMAEVNAEMAVVSDELAANVVDRMDTATSPAGVGHPPLDPDYVTAKLRKGYSRKVWEATGKAKRSVTGEYVAGVLRTSINVDYAKYPNRRRPVLGVSDKDREVITNGLRRAWRRVTDV